MNVFISYSRADLDSVRPVKEELEASGFSCWMDVNGIESGSEEFTDSIIGAIDDSVAVLFFLSASSQDSKWALKEIDYAVSGQKHVVLVRINDDPMTKKFRFNFGRSDIIDWRRPEQKDKLFDDLRRWISSGPAQRIDPGLTRSDKKDRHNVLSSLGRRHAHVSNASSMIDDLASAMVVKYRDKGYGVQRLAFEQDGESGVLVQIKNSKSGVGSFLRLATGLSSCATLKLLRVGNDLEIKVFAGKWIDKIGAGVVSWFVLWPLLLTAAFGAYRQMTFLDEVYDSAVAWASSHRD